MKITYIVSSLDQILFRPHSDLQDLFKDDHKHLLHLVKERDINKFSYGLDANKPTTPALNDVYWATDTKKYYYCYTVGTWSEINWIFTPKPIGQGEIIFYDGTKWERLASPVSSSRLTHPGGTNNPTWSIGSGIGLGWEIIKTETFTNDINITGLNGNIDKLWSLVIRTRNTSIFKPYLRFNNDIGTNYHYSDHSSRVVGGTVYHDYTNITAATSIDLGYFSTLEHFCNVLIAARAGEVRKITGNTSSYGSASTYGQSVRSGFWVNTVDNITSINIITGSITLGEYWLFRQVS